MAVAYVPPPEPAAWLQPCTPWPCAEHAAIQTGAALQVMSIPHDGKWIVLCGCVMWRSVSFMLHCAALRVCCAVLSCTVLPYVSSGRGLAAAALNYLSGDDEELEPDASRAALILAPGQNTSVLDVAVVAAQKVRTHSFHRRHQALALFQPQTARTCTGR